MASNQFSPTVLVIFGVTGDLAQRKILPALYHLQRRDLLPGKFRIVGFARRDWSKQDFAEQISLAVRTEEKIQPGVLQELIEKADYLQGDFDDPEAYVRLKKYLDELDVHDGTKYQRIFHLATAPSYYQKIFAELGKSGLSQGAPLPRVLVEKPFGHDEETASNLNNILLNAFSEEQIYRIDHYLGKELIQNLLSFRFANGVFEQLWNNRHIDNIQITAAERIGVGSRGSYYEQAGVIRDIVQNHLLQLLALIAMEEPDSLNAEAIRSRKSEVLQQTSFSSEPANIVRAQYQGYRQEKNVDAKSEIETFVALKAAINNERWDGVPFYIRAGKNLDKKYTEMVVEFKTPKEHFLGHTQHPLEPNLLRIRVEPEERISLELLIRKPGFETFLEPVEMDFKYQTKYQDLIPDAYEKILYEAMLGQQMVFVRSDAVLRQWQIVDDLRKNWQDTDLLFYERGSKGPIEQDQMLAKDGRAWH